MYNPLVSTAATSLRAHRALSDWTRVTLLDELRQAPSPLDAQGLAERAGIHVNTVRFHLEVLSRAGLVISEVERRSRRGRPRRLWRATADAGPEGGYRMLAEALAGYLEDSSPDAEGLGLQIGSAWGARLVRADGAAVGEGLHRVVGLLSRLGFSPELAEVGGRTRINLHRCPFLEVASGNRRLVCSAHLGLLRGALAEVGAPVTVSDLEPLVEPSLCVAHLTAGPPAASLAEG